MKIHQVAKAINCGDIRQRRAAAVALAKVADLWALHTLRQARSVETDPETAGLLGRAVRACEKSLTARIVKYVPGLAEGGGKARESIVRSLSSGNPGQVRAAVKAIAMAGNVAAIDAIIELARKSNDPITTIVCLEALGMMGSKREAFFILSFTSNEDRNVRSAALLGLYMIGKSFAWSLMVGIAARARNHLAREALSLLTSLGEERLSRLLSSMLSSADPRAAESAVDTIAALGDSPYAGLLEGVLSHHRPELRDRAQMALAGLATLGVATARKVLGSNTSPGDLPDGSPSSTAEQTAKSAARGPQIPELVIARPPKTMQGRSRASAPKTSPGARREEAGESSGTPVPGGGKDDSEAVPVPAWLVAPSGRPSPEAQSNAPTAAAFDTLDKASARLQPSPSGVLDPTNLKLSQALNYSWLGASQTFEAPGDDVYDLDSRPEGPALDLQAPAPSPSDASGETGETGSERNEPSGSSMNDGAGTGGPSGASDQSGVSADDHPPVGTEPQGTQSDRVAADVASATDVSTDNPAGMNDSSAKAEAPASALPSAIGEEKVEAARDAILSHNEPLSPSFAELAESAGTARPDYAAAGLALAGGLAFYGAILSVFAAAIFALHLASRWKLIGDPFWTGIPVAVMLVTAFLARPRKEKRTWVWLPANRHEKLERVLRSAALKVRAEPLQDIMLTPGAAVEIRCVSSLPLLPFLAGEAVSVGALAIEFLSTHEIKVLAARAFALEKLRAGALGSYPARFAADIEALIHRYGKANPLRWYLAALRTAFLAIASARLRETETRADKLTALAYGTNVFSEIMQTGEVMKALAGEIFNPRTGEGLEQGFDRILANFRRKLERDEQNCKKRLTAESTGRLATVPSLSERLQALSDGPGRRTLVRRPARSLFEDWDAVKRSLDELQEGT